MPIFSYTDHGRVGKRTAQPSEPRHPLHIIGHSIGCPFFAFMERIVIHFSRSFKQFNK